MRPLLLGARLGGTVAGESTARRAWHLFDRIIARALVDGGYSRPWSQGSFHPDYATLERLLGAVLALDAPTTSGAPALALDVWTAYELRRAGFDPDAVWPRDQSPRVVPTTVTRLLDSLPAKERAALQARLDSGKLSGVTGSSASILGKHYLKQVDVIMSAWDTGPELLISTKRMDSSFGKNAANRVEESYGDAKNLRSRHPMAALGFMYGLRSTILETEPDKANWLIDLLTKLGREDDAYDAVCLLMIDYDDALAPEDSDGGYDADDDALVAAGLEAAEPADPSDRGDVPFDADAIIDRLPRVSLLRHRIPAEISPERFFEVMVRKVLDATPVTMHREARARLRGAG